MEAIKEQMHDKPVIWARRHVKGSVCPDKKHHQMVAEASTRGILGGGGGNAADATGLLWLSSSRCGDLLIISNMSCDQDDLRNGSPPLVLALPQGPSP